MKLTRRAAAFILSAGLAFASATAVAADHPRVKFTTNVGEFVVEVYPDKAPKTVENFLTYVKAKFYDGTIFHRVIGHFMIQGGGFTEAFNQKPTRPPVAHEGATILEKGGPKNTVGTIAMARTGDPNSATAQFFINVADNASLDPVPGKPGYVAFGKVVSGMETVNKIKAMKTGPGGPFPTDVPQTPVIIQSATLVQ
ncbi:MAG TPA: peptidylprolyl isomerase [Ramlibacter sp.]|nr:peptidylprolyl isomerase [Ramlibacter sp.]